MKAHRKLLEGLMVGALALGTLSRSRCLLLHRGCDVRIGGEGILPRAASPRVDLLAGARAPQPPSHRL